MDFSEILLHCEDKDAIVSCRPPYWSPNSDVYLFGVASGAVGLSGAVTAAVTGVGAAVGWLVSLIGGGRKKKAKKESTCEDDSTANNGTN